MADRKVISLSGAGGNRDSSGGYLAGDESQGLWDDDDDYVESVDDDEQDDDEPLDDVWSRAAAVAVELEAIEAASSRIREGRIFDPTDASPDELQARFDVLSHELHGLDFEMEMRGRPPAGWFPPPINASGSDSADPRPRTLSVDEVVRHQLTELEREHWDWLTDGITQSVVARRLGISQVAVSKREKKLRARVDEICVAATGRPYHWAPVSARRGGRPRRR